MATDTKYLHSEISNSILRAFYAVRKGLPADIVINDKVIIKMVQADTVSGQHKSDIRNQLRLSKYEVGLILNFATEGDHKRIVFTNDLNQGNRFD